MILFSAAWIYIGIQSPWLIFCFYPLLKRKASWLGSPFIVFPSVIAVCLVIYTGFYRYGWRTAYYPHFLFAGVFVLTSYLCLLRLRYERFDSLTLSSLVIIAIDQLWQTPFNAINWTSSLQGFALGFTTAGWDLMAIPFVFYFLLKFKGKLQLDREGWAIFSICCVLTAFETWRFYAGGYPDNLAPSINNLLAIEPYYLSVAWFVFFLALFRASARRDLRNESESLPGQLKTNSLLRMQTGWSQPHLQMEVPDPHRQVCGSLEPDRDLDILDPLL